MSRAILVALENTGRIQWVEEFFPDGPIKSHIKTLIDSIAEFAEEQNCRNLFGTKYAKLVILVDATCTKQRLRDQIATLGSQYDFLDLAIIGHGGATGSQGRLELHGGEILGEDDVREWREQPEFQNLNLGLVYMMNCQGSKFNDTWIRLGFKTSIGPNRNNYMPETMFSEFWKKLMEGKTAKDAAHQSWEETKTLWEVVYSLTPDNEIDDSRPIVAGNQSLRFTDGPPKAHIHSMNVDGRVGARIERRIWCHDWQHVQPFKAAGELFLFLLKTGNGFVHIHRVKDDGTVGAEVKRYDWSKGSTTARFFTTGSQTYLFLLKEKGVGGDGKNVHIHEMNSDGTVGRKIGTNKWTEGWTTAEFFTMGSKTYLFILKAKGTASDGKNVHIYEMNSDGTLGPKVDNRKWTEGWTTARFFTMGSQTYLFLLKEKGVGGDGKNVHIHEMNSDGTVGRKIGTNKWTEGWTTAEFFTMGSKTYLFILKAKGKASDGKNVHIYEINSDGTLGPKVDSRKWTEGWTMATFYTINAKTFLFLLRRR